MPRGRGNAPSKSGKETWDRHSKKKRKHQHYKKRNENYSSGFHSNKFAAHSIEYNYSDKHQQLNLQSNTDNNNLQQFIDTMQVRLIDNNDNTIHFNPNLETAKIFNINNLPIPRKPKWNKNMNITREEYHKMENEIYLNWRRNLAKTFEYVSNKNGLNKMIEMSPFEKNIQIWKQLWRVIEKSNLLIIIVDARNPLFFISNDLLKYIKEIDKQKKYMILINKSDFLTKTQRKFWKRYFNEKNIEILYFSAIKEQKKLNLISKSKREIKENKENKEENDSMNEENHGILNCNEIIQIFVNEKYKMDLDKIFVGLIGSPNVGKSSIMNVLCGKKVCKMGSMPGKTKHFQTIYLKNDIVLCDCPGLVFPSFTSSKSDMILNGIIPIDNLRDFIKPIELMINRINIIKQLNNIYKLKLEIKNKKITAYDILDSYCNKKKMYNKGKATDRNKAAKIILKDYVNGKIIYNHCPTNLDQQNRAIFYSLANDNKHKVQKNSECSESV